MPRHWTPNECCFKNVPYKRLKTYLLTVVVLVVRYITISYRASSHVHIYDEAFASILPHELFMNLRAHAK